jgi:FlaA1/EpsC-like NDP-sugar epimerase
VTHADATRYFVTAREAVRLLLHSACIGAGGDLLVPDLGPPVNILDLARRLRGAADVPIVITGLRPGEKLEEELWTEAEQLRPTAVRGLFRLEGPRPPRLDVERWVRELGGIVHRREESSLVAKVREIVPEYRPDASTMDAVGRRGLAQ